MKKLRLGLLAVFTALCLFNINLTSEVKATSSFEVKIEYIDGESGAPLINGDTFTMNEGESKNITLPTIEDSYMPGTNMVTGYNQITISPNAATTFYVTYYHAYYDTGSLRTYTVKYINAVNNEEIMAPTSKAMYAGSPSFNEYAPNIEGYEVNENVKPVNGNEVIFTYSKTEVVGKNFLFIKYQYADGRDAAELFADNIKTGNSYSIKSPTIQGYTPDQTIVSGVMGDTNKEIVVTYKPNPVKLVINYKFDNGNTAINSHTSLREKGSSYIVSSPLIDGYTANYEIVKGTIDSDQIINVIYTKNPTPVVNDNNNNQVIYPNNQTAPTTLNNEEAKETTKEVVKDDEDNKTTTKNKESVKPHYGNDDTTNNNLFFILGGLILVVIGLLIKFRLDKKQK